MKNVEIGTLNTSIAKNSLVNESNMNQNNKKSPRDRSTQQTLFENVAANNLTPSALNGL